MIKSILDVKVETTRFSLTPTPATVPIIMAEGDGEIIHSLCTIRKVARFDAYDILAKKYTGFYSLMIKVLPPKNGTPKFPSAGNGSSFSHFSLIFMIKVSQLKPETNVYAFSAFVLPDPTPHRTFHRTVVAFHRKTYWLPQSPSINDCINLMGVPFRL